MQWIECERCLHISPNPYGQRAPMIQPSKTANLRAAPGAARRMRNHACPVRRGATTMPSSRRQRKHPSLYVLRTWAILCKPVRLTAKVAEEGLELVVVFAGKSYILSAAGDKLGIISAKEKR